MAYTAELNIIKELPHSEKIKGFCVVKHLINMFPEFAFLVQGGSSSYLHALNEKNVEIELYDIDILVGSKDINTNNKIVNFITNNYKNIKFKDEQSSIFYVYIGNDIILNFFINEATLEEILSIKMVKVFGINIKPFNIVIEEERKMLENVSQDLEYCIKNNEPDEEIQYFKDKVRRKKEFLNLFN